MSKQYSKTSNSKGPRNKGKYGKQNNTKGRKVYKGSSRNFQDENEISEFNKGFNRGVARGIAAPIQGKSNTDNDPNWYVPNTQLTKDAASIPFGVSNGLPILPQRNVTVSQNIGFSAASMTVPGVCVLTYMPTLGRTQSPVDPVNLAGATLYSQLQAQSGRTPAYEMADLLKWIVSLGSAYTYYMWMVRAYGTMSKFSMLNRYTPRTLIEAMGINYNDIQGQLANFRIYINQYAYRLSTFPIPSNLDYLNRQIFMVENIYTDSETNKAQYYMYNPAGFYLYEEGTPATQNQSTVTFNYWLQPSDDSSLVGNPITKNTNLKKLSDIITFGNSLLEPLRSSEDLRMMCADFLNTFGPQSMFNVTPISETYEIEFSYNQEVLMQMENAYVYPRMKSLSAQFTEATDINGGYLIATYDLIPYAPNVPGDTDFGSALKQSIQNSGDALVVLNSHKSEVSPEDVLVMTRLASGGMLNYTRTGNSDDDYIYHTTPLENTTEIVVALDVYYMLYGTNNVPYTVRYPLSTYEGYNSTTDTVTTIDDVVFPSSDYVISALGRLAAFDWHPRVGFVAVHKTSAGKFAVQQTQPCWDLDNWTTISEEELDHINYVAMQGLFSLK